MKLQPTCKNQLRNSRADVIASAVAALEPPPKMTTSEWADTYRQMPPESPIKGRWRTENAPYQREPMDVIAHPDVKVLVLMWGSQLGKTEVLLNIMGRHIHIDPASMMFALPTLDLVEGFSDERVQPMIDLSPELAEKAGSGKTRDKTNQKKKKSFQGGYLVFVGANSPSSLASRAVQVFLGDELDKFKLNIGNDGDPITQAIQRTTNFWNAEVCLTSTPSLKNKSAIEKWWEEAQQFYYHVPCPYCRAEQFLDFFPKEDHETGQLIGGVRWEEGKPSRAKYSCPKCGSTWTQKQIRNATAKGRWVSTQEPNEDGIVGYHVNSLYSFSPKNSIVNLARLWERSKGDPLKEQTFWNLKLGLTYDPSQESKTTPYQLSQRREDYGPERMPEEVLLITAGVDVQHNRLEIQWLGWGIGDESWVLDHMKLAGDPTDIRIWDELDRVLLREFEHKSGKELRAEAVAVDSGNWTQKVYDYARRAQETFRPIYAVKGVAGQGKPIWVLSQQMLKKGTKLHLVGVDTGKAEIYGCLAKREVAPGYIHFPAHLELEFFQQLVSNRIDIEFTNAGTRQKWILPAGKQDEALDCMNYARAVRYSLSIDYEARREWLYEPEDKKETSLEELADLF